MADNRASIALHSGRVVSGWLGRVSEIGQLDGEWRDNPDGTCNRVGIAEQAGRARLKHADHEDHHDPAMPLDRISST